MLDKDGLPLSAFVYFGGKRKVADLVWSKFGNVKAYCEPFAGSLAVLLKNKQSPLPLETVNDMDHFICNFWRATRDYPEEVARWSDNPVHEIECNLRHRWLKEQRPYLKELIESGLDTCDPKIAGWWAWLAANWVGSGMCTDSKSNQIPYLSSAGQGILRVNTRDVLPEYFKVLSKRFKRVRVLHGNWDRCLGPSTTTRIGVTGVFLDPPYEDNKITSASLYTHEKPGVAQEAMEWAINNGNKEDMRIAYCGYNGLRFPSDWKEVQWKAGGGYANQSKGDNNAHRETIWFSPHCLKENECLTMK